MENRADNMNAGHVDKIAKELGILPRQAGAVVELLSGGATVPFIARYRKEATGSLDEVAISAVRDALEKLEALDARRQAIKKSLKERGLLDVELEGKLDSVETLSSLEDIYEPFRPKRRTKATVAKERGLEPLADIIMDFNKDCSLEAPRFVDESKDVADVAAALSGARDIIAERISENAEARSAVREYFEREAQLVSKVVSAKEAEGVKYKDYFNWSEPAKSAPSHRILAIRRGEAEGFLYMRVVPQDDGAAAILKDMFMKGAVGENRVQMELALEDSYKRLLSASAETHMRLELKKRADEDAVKVFASNLRELLMAPPLGGKNVLALDPGFRTGCKLVCLNRQGDLLLNDVIYPEQGSAKRADAESKILKLCAAFDVEAIAIGNGTAGRETEDFIRSLGLPKKIEITMVNESGASIYSASEVAREEFPNHDITVRGAVSIGRRLMDPLAELVKIDPKSIGVGQYQHDVNQTLLKRSLDDVVVSCVSNVGVEVNTASRQLLSYVSGLNSTIAANIVAYRNQNGPFKSRRQLMDVKGLGAKTFEQAAGFLRIGGAENPLDGSAVHPERYRIVESMAKDLGTDVGSLMKDASVRAKIDLGRYVSEDVGMPTLTDIMQELAKPARDPREKFESFRFADGVNSIDDLKEGMRLPGIVTNVVAFGAFVDIGVHQDGLVHISEVSDSYVGDVSAVLKPGQKVNVYVLEVDIPRKRISLSMKSNPQKKDKFNAAQDSAGGSKERAKTPLRTYGKTKSYDNRRGENFGFSFGDVFSKLGK